MDDRGRICNRAREYGRLVREFEDGNLNDSRRKTRVEWRTWYKGLEKEEARAAVDAYYDEYCREPTEDE